MITSKEYKEKSQKVNILTLKYLQQEKEMQETYTELDKAQTDIVQMRSEIQDCLLKNFSDLETTVYIMNVFQGYTLNDIAKKLNFSYDYIKHLKCKTTRKLNKLMRSE